LLWRSHTVRVFTRVVSLGLGPFDTTLLAPRGRSLWRARRDTPRQGVLGQSCHGASVRAITDSMAQLLVRDLDDELVVALRKRAAKHGRSVEAEHRAILKAALRKAPARDFKELLLAIPKSQSDEDEADFNSERDLARDVDLE
ncbi:MAG: hypothetical protein RL701_2636, partial [Pseudomonadota bacterium]